MYEDRYWQDMAFLVFDLGLAALRVFTVIPSARICNAATALFNPFERLNFSIFFCHRYVLQLAAMWQ